MISVSVIMPVYNSEKYLAKAIISVLDQTFKDLELILIDDGSQDNSLVICDMYADNDERIKVIHQTNSGICAARNKGLEDAQGEYIAFIDHDDLYSPTLLEENHKLAKQYDADVIKFGNEYIEDKNSDAYNFKYNKILDEKKLLFINKENLKESYEKINEAELMVYVWDGLFKASMIRKHNVFFDTSFKYGHEDRVFCMQLYPYINCMIINPKIYYYHIVHKSSASRNFSVDRIKDTEKLLGYEHILFNKLQLDKIYPLYWLKRIMVYIIAIFSIIRKPESQLTFEETLLIVQELRSKYYVDLDVCQLKLGNNEKRFKNRVYVCLFQHNYPRLLSLSLLGDRAVKRLIKRK